MLLLLLRHGLAEDAGPATGYRDEPRALTPEGMARMRREARGMKALRLRPELILSSPLTRCLQTAEIVQEALGGDLEDDPRLAPGMSLEDLADAISDRGAPGCVVACGHEPSLSRVACELIGGGAIELRKGGLAIVEAEAMRSRGARLKALYPPSSLRRLGG